MPMPMPTPTVQRLPSAERSAVRTSAGARLRELELVRALAILAVLIVHSTSEGTVDFPVGSRSQMLYLVVNRLSTFAVPVFLMLSGVVLFYRYRSGPWGFREALDFYRKRLQYIVVPYLVWSLFYYFFNRWSAGLDLSFSPREFAGLLPWGDAKYHLYFIIILQFYAVFPLLMSLVRRFPAAGRLLPLIGLTIQTAAYAFHHYGPGFRHAPSLAVTYAFVLCAGSWIGLRYVRMRAWLERCAWMATAAALFGAGLAGFHALAQFGVNFGQATYAVLFHGYGWTACISLIVLSLYVLERWPAVAAALASLGSVSFGVYFLHPAILLLWRDYLPAAGGMAEYHALAFGGFAAAAAVSWAFARAVRGLPGSWVVLGK